MHCPYNTDCIASPVVRALLLARQWNDRM